jgi:non-canonical purine NTP pyrophosphatase (RdgB/HAM1 family)
MTISLPEDTIVVATGNPHKVREIDAIFARVGVRAIALSDLPDAPFEEPVEDGTTFEANSTLKAKAYAALTGRPCLADDSGLMVDALGGAPGVISSHYSTDGQETGLSREQRDAANNHRLLTELARVPLEQRTARFVCVMVLAMPKSVQKNSDAVWKTAPHGEEESDSEASIMAVTRGEFHGRIGLPGDVPRGLNGFGYDPLFLVAPHYTHAAAELPSEQKNAISHRAIAAAAMAEQIKRLRG